MALKFVPIDDPAHDDVVSFPVESAVGKPTAARWKEGSITARELQKKKFEPLAYVVDGLITEGVTLLVGKPKVAKKTWLALDIALGASANRQVLGSIRPAQGDVLGIFLEDNDRRLQRRLDKLLPTFVGEWPERLTLKTTWPRLDQGGLADIEAWCISCQKAGGSPRLVIIDTLARIRPLSSKGNATPYELDYLALGSLQQLALQYRIAIVVIHHQRKADGDDIFDTVSGTLGLTGAADTTIIIARSGAGTVLHAIGRDIEECEKAINFDPNTCRYTILGDAATIHRSNERNAILDVLKSSKEALGPKDIADATQMKGANVRVLLGKMVAAGEIVKGGYGRYSVATEAPCTPHYTDYTDNTGDTDNAVGA